MCAAMAEHTREALPSATGDIIVTLDGDHSYPADALAYLLEAFLHLEVDFLNALAFPGARSAAP